jgi:hypothetical protein
VRETDGGGVVKGNILEHKKISNTGIIGLGFVAYVMTLSAARLYWIA